MVYQILAALVALLALLLFIITARLLGTGRWLSGFIRGTCGLLVLAGACVVSLIAYDLTSYRSATDQQIIATISFRQQQDQQFLVEIQPIKGAYFNADLQGEQWELKIRALKWPPLLTASGLALGYRFDAVKSRYLTLDKKGQGSQQILEQSQFIDFWRIAHDAMLNPLGMRAELESLGLVGLVDGAIFDVQVSGDRLQVKPMNEAANKAMHAW